MSVPVYARGRLDAIKREPFFEDVVNKVVCELKRPIVVLIVAFLSWVSVGDARAKGPKSGFELALHGTTEVPYGKTARFRGIAYQVTGLAQLKALPNAKVRARYASDAGAPGPWKEIRAGQNGLFSLALAMPQSSKGASWLELFVGNGTDERRFEFPLELTSPWSVDLRTDRQLYEPGETIHAWARIRDVDSLRPLNGKAAVFEFGGTEKRLAAGLWLVDTGDVPAQEMVRLAKAALVPGKRGGKRLPGEKGDAVDGWIGTLALAIAAHQLGDDPLVSELVAGITPRMYLGMQGAKEPAFWLLAASAYGVLGVRNPEQVRVVVNGKSSTLPLKDGSAVLQLPSAQATVRVQSDSPLMARVEARYVIEIRKSSTSSLEAKIIGDVGVSGGVAALEIAIENTGSEELASPVVEVNLPSPGVLSAESRAQMEGSSRVLSVAQADKMGIVRIRLASLAAKESISIPLPIRWKGRGLVKGLSVSAYNAKTPWKVSSTPARTIRLKPAKKENWK